MIVYEATKELFIADVIKEKIRGKIDKKFYKKVGYHTGESKRNSMEDSMQYMLKVLYDSKIPDTSGTAIEFRIPNTSKRVDFIISGKDQNLKSIAIIVELKQWQS